MKRFRQCDDYGEQMVSVGIDDIRFYDSTERVCCG